MDVEWDLQIRFWGYELHGGSDDLALLVESRVEMMGVRGPWWDGSAVDLSQIRRWHGMEEVEVPEYWALPAVCELMGMRDAAFWKIAEECEL